ncbi:MAG: fused response regulator/phosphatase [Rickettsiales bacterium]|nr:fused response regulator/phosphatase [Rickettsiales bacterium]
MDNQRLREALILVVDDSQLNLKILSSNLRVRGYTNLIFAHNGREAVEMTHEHKPELVILDLMMPDMDGFDYCRTIRQDEQFRTMPIIVQTALDEIEHKLNAFNVGASDYICKPVDGGELESRVQVHLTNRMLLQDLVMYNQHIRAEMEAAKAMQLRLMPSEHQIKMCERVFDIQIASYFETSSTLGGDCWGMRPLSDDKLAIYMYDFSGHGISAAMNIFRMHTIMREFNHTSGDAGHFLTALNHQLYPLLERTAFATMFYGVIDTKANCLQYASAAVPSPLLCARTEITPLRLIGRGFPLGVLPHATYETHYTAFLPGDLLVFFSDCLIETRNSQGIFLSDAKIASAVQGSLQESNNLPHHAIQALRDLMAKHSKAPLVDDITINAYWRLP